MLVATQSRVRLIKGHSSSVSDNSSREQSCQKLRLTRVVANLGWSLATLGWSLRESAAILDVSDLPGIRLDKLKRELLNASALTKVGSLTFEEGKRG